MPALAASWPMHGCDATNSSYNAQQTDFDPELSICWDKYPDISSDENRTRPVSDGENTYIGSTWEEFSDWAYNGRKGHLQAIALSTGKVIWTITDALVHMSPALSNGFLFYPTLNERLCAVKADDGSPVWQASLNGAPNSPAIFGNTLYVSTITGYVYAIDSSNGNVLWSKKCATSCTQAAVTNAAVFVGGTHVFALNPSTGATMWMFDGGATHSAPAVRGDSVFVTSQYNIYCVNAITGTLKWSKLTTDYYEAVKTPVISGIHLYIGTVMALDPKDGSLEWNFAAKNSVKQAQVAVADGYVFVGGRYDVPNSFSTERHLYVLRESNGECIWSFSTPALMNDGPSCIPSPSVEGRFVLVNLSTKSFCCFASPIKSKSICAVSLSRDIFNPYAINDGNTSLNVTLESTATTSITVCEPDENVVKLLLDSKLLGAGTYTFDWQGIIEFPELADPTLAEQLNDRGILIAPDGRYIIKVETKSGVQPPQQQSTEVMVKSDV